VTTGTSRDASGTSRDAPGTSRDAPGTSRDAPGRPARPFFSGRPGVAATRAEAVQAAGVAVALTAAWRLVTPLVGQPVCCDAGHYLEMAADPGQAVIRPYSSRVLVPWLVHLLGGEPATTYHAISLACLAASGLLVYLLARRLGASHGWALAATAGLLCSRGWVFYLYDPYLSDPAAFALLAGAFLALVRARPTWLVAPLLVLMAGTRELFAGVALPVYAWLASGRRLDRAAALRTAALLAPAVVAFVLVLAYAPSLPSVEYSQSPATVLGHVLRTRMDQDGPFWLGSAFAMSLGVWWPLAVAGLGSGPVRRLAWLLAPVFANFLIGWDWSRYALYAFPVVMPAAALALARSPRPRLLLGVVALQALLPLADLAAGKPQLNRAGPSLAISLALIAAVSVLLLLDRGRSRSPALVSRAGSDPPQAGQAGASGTR